MNESMRWQDQLLASKFFVPTFSHALISRPRLTALLDAGVQRKLTLLSAPVGFGKTTLLRDWLRSRPSGSPPVAWVSLDEGDNDPVRFWTYVLTALHSSYPDISQQTLTYLHMSQTPPIQSILTLLINNIATRTEPCLLILDDYHVITEHAIHDAFLFLLEHGPSQLHVTLSTRVDPPLPLSRRRARGQIVELRTDQLRCTREEATAFLAGVMGLSLAAEEIQQVETRTEGWIAGLQLAALSLQGRADRTEMLAELRGSQRYILDYLTDEVLRQQPIAVQTFLLYTSVLERLSAPLCDAVMQQRGSQEMLEELERANLFVVSLDEHRRWYRYHALFVEALRYRLERLQAALVPTLHRRASEWYAQQQHFNEAVQHALQAHAWERAAELIEHVAFTLSYSGSEPNKTAKPLREIVTLLMQREPELSSGVSPLSSVPLLRWLKLLPPEVVRLRPYLCLIYAEMLFLVAPPTTVEAQQQAGVWLQEAEAALTVALAAQTTEGAVIAPQERYRQENLLGSILALRALITSYHGDGQVALSLCQQALTHISEQNLAVRALVAITQSLAYAALGEALPAAQCALQARVHEQDAESRWQAINHEAVAASYLIYQGKLHEAWQMCQHAIELAVQLVSESGGLLPPIVSIAYGHQADVLRQWNQLDAAQELVLQGIELAERAALLSTLDLSYAVLARIHLARGELDAAAAALSRAEQVDEQLHNPYVQTLYLCVDRVRLWLRRGEIERASHWAEELLRKERQTSPFAQERESVALVRILLVQEKPGEALIRLAPLLEGATKQERWDHVIEMLLLQALSYQMRQQEQGALETLVQAMRLAEPEGYIRRFVDEGSSMARLLALLREQQRKQGPTPYLDSVLAAFSSIERAREPGTPSPGGTSLPGKNTAHIPQQPLLDPLSERELDVLRLLARGASNQEIAEELVVALNTVKHHMGNITSKLGASNRTQAVVRARILGLLPNEP